MEIVRKIQQGADKTGSPTAGQTAAPTVIPKKAFTLIELLVYMAIMGFIIVVAGRAFSDSTGMRVRSQNMLSSIEEAGRISAILKEDISQMGAKSVVKNVGSQTDKVFNFTVANNEVHWGSTDSSSYELEPGLHDSLDVLTFKKLHYDADGECAGVSEIKWHVRADSTLIRECKSLQFPGYPDVDDSDCPKEIEMARNIAKFKFLPSKPGTKNTDPDTLFNSGANLTLIDNAGATVSGLNLGPFTKNTDLNGTIHSNYYLPDGTNCKKFYFKADEEYAVNFNLNYLAPTLNDPCKDGTTSCATSQRYNPMVMFQAGYDHLSLGLRNPSGNHEPTTEVPDFLFFPPQDATANQIIRHFKFSVREDTTACIGITAAFYSDAAKGHLDINNLTVTRLKDNVYHFVQGYTTSNAKEKAQVKAFELSLNVKKKDEINRVITVIPVPNNGTGGN